MNSLLLTCIIVTLAMIPIYLVRQLRTSQQALIQSEKARLQLESGLKFNAKEDSPSTTYPNMRVIVEISDPIALAKREQPLTRYVSQLAPDLIIQKVYEQVANEIATGLKEKQVAAQTTIEVR